MKTSSTTTICRTTSSRATASYNYTSTVVNYFSRSDHRQGTCNSSGSGVGSASGGFFPCYNSFVQGFGKPLFELAHHWTIGFFVQDDWKLTPRLTLNLGVRYDCEKLPGPFSLAQLKLAADHQHPSDNNNISPRIGFAWDPYGRGKTVVHGGFGIYYGRIFNALLLNTYENTGAANAASSTYSFTSSHGRRTAAAKRRRRASACDRARSQHRVPRSTTSRTPTPSSSTSLCSRTRRADVLSVSATSAPSAVELPNYLNVNLNPANTYTFNYVVAPGPGTANCGPLACGTVIPAKVYANKTRPAPPAPTYNYVTQNPDLQRHHRCHQQHQLQLPRPHRRSQRRASKVLTFDANYTWSHALDFNQNLRHFAQHQQLVRSRSATPAPTTATPTYDVRHRAVGWAILNVPGTAVATGRTHLHHQRLVHQARWCRSSPACPTRSPSPAPCPTSATPLDASRPAGSGLSGTGVTYIPALGRNSHLQSRTRCRRPPRPEGLQVRARSTTCSSSAKPSTSPTTTTGQRVNTTAYSLSTTQGATAASTSANLVYSPTYTSITSANSNYAFNVRLIQIAARLIF